ncbi:MAG: hypothetical protein ACKO9H_05870, partial [Planctomycetota bacterium]
MGVLKFSIPASWSLEKRQASSLHVVGLDGMAWPCRIAREAQTLTINRNKDESGHLYMVYPFHDHGELVVSTGTLPEGSTEYQLTRELARGTLNRLRNQLSNWIEGGMRLDESVHALVAEATRSLEHAIFTAEPTKAEAAASESLEHSIKAIFAISEAFAEQITPIRRSQINLAKYWFGARLGVWDQAVANQLVEYF